MIEAISVALIGVVIVVAAIDLVPILKEWVSRIHIGRYQDRSTWSRAITNKGMSWLNRTPKIKVTDNTRLVVLDMLRGNYTRTAIQHWQEAALLMGLAEALNRSPNETGAAQVRQYLSAKFDGNGQWREKPEHVDGAILAYSIMKLNIINIDHYKPALDACWQLIQAHIGTDGTVAYRKIMADYRYVDTIGFICPFLVAYGVRYGEERCVKLAVKQIAGYEAYGMLGDLSLPCHAYRTDNKMPLGLYGWGRGLGWYALGLIDAWRELPADSPYKIELQQSVIRFARTAIRFQSPGGHWNWTVTRPEARPDSSATAALAWFLLNAMQIEQLAGECGVALDKAIHYLMAVTRRSGAVDFSQGDTKDIGVYSGLFTTLPFTQGLCIRLMNGWDRQCE